MREAHAQVVGFDQEAINSYCRSGARSGFRKGLSRAAAEVFGMAFAKNRGFSRHGAGNRGTKWNPPPRDFFPCAAPRKPAESKVGGRSQAADKFTREEPPKGFPRTISLETRPAARVEC